MLAIGLLGEHFYNLFAIANYQESKPFLPFVLQQNIRSVYHVIKGFCLILQNASFTLFFFLQLSYSCDTRLYICLYNKYIMAKKKHNMLTHDLINLDIQYAARRLLGHCLHLPTDSVTHSFKIVQVSKNQNISDIFVPISFNYTRSSFIFTPFYRCQSFFLILTSYRSLYISFVANKVYNFTNKNVK